MKSRYLHIALLALLASLLYSNTLGVPFILDEMDYIVRNPAVHDLSYFTHPSKMDEVPTLTPSIRQSFRVRMLGQLSFALNYKLHGYDVAGYHIVNIAIHVAASVLVYFLVLLIFRTPLFLNRKKSPPHEFIALFSALVFAAHPVQTESVTYIAQRFTSLAALFYLFSLVLYLKARFSAGRPRLILLALSVFSALLAMDTKQNAFTLPISAALIEFMFFKASLKERLKSLAPLFLTLPVVPLLMMLSTRGEGLSRGLRTMGVSEDISRTAYLFTQFRVLVRYLRLVFLPTGLNLDYDFPIFKSFFNPQVFFSFFLLLLIAAFGLYIFLRFRKSENAGLMRLFSFGIFWFFITLSVESSIFPLGDIIFEYRLYLPMAGFIPGLLAGGCLILTRFKINLKAASALIIAAILALSVSTYARNSLWRDPVRLWEDTVQKSPLKVRARNNLAGFYIKEGRLKEAEMQLATAIALPDRSESSVLMSYSVLLELLTKQGRAAEAANLSGLLSLREGLFEGAETSFRQALELAPNYAEAHANLARCLEAKGNIAGAEAAYRKAVALAPQNEDLRNALGAFYRRTGRNPARSAYN